MLLKPGVYKKLISVRKIKPWYNCRMSKSTSKKPPVIGFLSGRMDEPYQYSVWRGAEEEARRIGAQLVFFGGQRVRSPVGYEALDNIAFDLAQRTSLSGLIVMANVIGTYLSAQEQSDFLNHFGSMPIVTVGVAYEGLESVTVNNKGSMRTVLEHLVTEHQRRHFLFLAGPTAHFESEERKKEFLDHHALLLPGSPPPVVLYADFQEHDAHNAVENFLASGGIIDAVVAANDLMAFGALRALSEAGINVPIDVSVTGYDDTENSRFSIPPLTTVRQPTRELGREALQRIAYAVGFFQGGPPQGIPDISFVIRQSCGCSKTEAPGYLGSTLNAHASFGLSKSDGEFLNTLVQAVNRELSSGRNPGFLRNMVFPSKLQEKASVIITEGEMRYQALLRTLVEQRSATLQEIGSSLVSSFDLNDVLQEVARAIGALGISACWLSLFDSPERTPVWARLYLAYSSEKVRILSPYGLRFRTSEILPGGLAADINSYICEPLRYGNERLGYFICTAEPTDRRVFEALRDQVSGAIKGALLVNAERDREKELEQEVRARTMELYTANERLIKEIDQRRTLEHELLQISNDIMGSIGRDIHDHLCQDIAGIGLRAALIEGMIKRSECSEAHEVFKELQEIVKASSKAAELAKNIARGLYPAELEARGLVKTIESLVISTQKRSTAQISMSVSPSFFINDSEKALQLYRIIQEAVGNAVSHSGAQEISISLSRDEHAVVVIVRDNGKGIQKKETNDSGMGLNIMKYRASVVMGELSIKSNNQGTEITCKVFA